MTHRPAADADFAGLLADVATAIEASVPTWRVRLGEAIARWTGEGIACDVLARALQLPDAPDVDGLLATFARAVERLRRLEREAAARDATLVGDPVFRDPARLREAEGRVAALRVPTDVAAALAGAPAAIPAPVEGARPVPRPIALDPECWVLAWPTVDALLVEDVG